MGMWGNHAVEQSSVSQDDETFTQISFELGAVVTQAGMRNRNALQAPEGTFWNEGDFLDLRRLKPLVQVQLEIHSGAHRDNNEALPTRSQSRGWGQTSTSLFCDVVATRWSSISKSSFSLALEPDRMTRKPVLPGLPLDPVWPPMPQLSLS